MQHLKSFDRIYLKQLRRLCLDNGLSVPSFPVSTEFGQFLERMNAEIEKCRVGMETGLFLSAPLVRVFVGSTPVGGNAESGADLGMVVALQNHSGLTSTGDGMLRFYKAFGHPNFALVLDTGNFTGRDGPPSTTNASSISCAAFNTTGSAVWFMKAPKMSLPLSLAARAFFAG